jgi:hypothetical protein
MPKFQLTVPVDASGIEGVEKGHPLKVAAVDARGRVVSQIVRLEAGKATATFAFDDRPEGLRILVGPRDAADDEIDKLQTLAVTVPEMTRPELALAPIKITPFYWDWWGRWCRTFTVHGRVVCPDGSPVPGAEVCAVDVDWFLWWRSTQQVGCTMTDVNGNFTLTFKWCCGWWPWWWWRLRDWELDASVYARILGSLKPEQRFRPIPMPDPVPDFKVLDALLVSTAGQSTSPTSVAGGLLPPMVPRITALTPATGFDFARADAIRERLAAALPQIREFESLRLWPWFPWAPWFDCAPDLIFKVTQDCTAKGTVIVDEQPWQTRWNIPTSLSVTLTANDRACCAGGPPCEGTDCLILTQVCSVNTDHIGGGVGAAPAPLGYAYPGTPGAAGDRPFAGSIDVYGTTDCMDHVDYYEFETAHFDEGTATWSAYAAMPVAQDGAFTRSYLDFSGVSFTWHSPSFGAVAVDGHNVFETRQHYEATHGPWVDRVWVGASRDQLISWITSSTLLSDGLYKLRVKGYKLVAGHLVEQVLNVCNGQAPSEVFIRVDNRLTPDPAHPATHPCGANTVHFCVTEPDTDIVSVTILKGAGGSETVAACGQYTLHANDHVQVRFVAHDPNGHLGDYTLRAFYGVSGVSDLLTHGTPTPDPFGAPPFATADVGGPSYVAVPTAQWKGGAFVITVDAGAFPITCCYTLELIARKRTIVNCSGDAVHYNVSQSSFMLTRV